MATKKTAKKAVKAKAPAKAEEQGSESAAQLTETVMIGGKAVSLRGKTLVGTVTSAKAPKTVTVEWERRRYVPKYERYERRRSHVAAHNPEQLNAREGDTVRIQECRPLSKTKHFVVTEIVTRGGAQ